MRKEPGLAQSWLEHLNPGLVTGHASFFLNIKHGFCIGVDTLTTCCSLLNLNCWKDLKVSQEYTIVRFFVYKDYTGLFHRIIKFCNLSVHFLACMYVSISAANDLRAEIVNCHFSFFICTLRPNKGNQWLLDDVSFASGNLHFKL